MQPRDSIKLCTVYLEQLKEWLSNTEGPNLIEGTEASKSDELLGMAVSFDPVCYYSPTGSNAVVGMGLVFKPAYIRHGVLQLLTDNTYGLVCQSEGEAI